MKGGIFATQLRSDWVQNMLVIATSDFGHEDLPWRERSLVALRAAGVEGQEFTSLELEDVVAPMVGAVPYLPERAKMVLIGLDTGILRKTGKLKLADRANRSHPSYLVLP